MFCKFSRPPVLCGMWRMERYQRVIGVRKRLRYLDVSLCYTFFPYSLQCAGMVFCGFSAFADKPLLKGLLLRHIKGGPGRLFQLYLDILCSPAFLGNLILEGTFGFMSVLLRSGSAMFSAKEKFMKKLCQSGSAESTRSFITVDALRQ